MFSTLSSYIWGEETQDGAGVDTPPSLPAPASAPAAAARDQSPDDWVLVGESHGPAPGDLGGALPPLPGSASSSETSSVAGEEPAPVAAAETEAAALPLAAPRHMHRAAVRIAQQAARREQRTVAAAQLTRQRNSGKALTSKALNRSNKAVYGHAGNKKQQCRQNLNIKTAGANKNLKQC